MPIGPINTKAQKANVVHQEMSKFKSGGLHSGSSTGPIVTNPKQAIAISLSESGQSKKSPVPSPEPVTKAPIPTQVELAPTAVKLAAAPGSHGFGHNITQRHGHLRNSGNGAAHRVGIRVK